MPTEAQNQALRKLPAVHYLLQKPEIVALIQESKFDLISSITSKIIEKERERILKEAVPSEVSDKELIQKIENQYIKLTTSHLHSVVNGTGIILHTNLGRAKLSNEAILSVQQAAAQYSNLEYRLEEGKRGSRYDHVEDLLIEITGAEAAMVVNNNASAVILVLKEMAQGKEVIVSRGQLVEIGGSFRVSEIMAQSGAMLVEVGTTNKTHLFDYERAITNQTGLLMKVHTSNFRMIGFTKEVDLASLVQLGKSKNIPVYEDLGSGVLYDLKRHGIGNEPTVQETVQAGADIISFSGDKLLGGPQTGIIVGKKKWIERLKKNQFTRSLRVDKMTLAALETTLRHYLLDEAADKIPTLQMILMSESVIEEKSKQLLEILEPLKKKALIQIIDGASEVGGGSLPDVKLPSKLISIQPFYMPIHVFEREMRLNAPHVIGRIVNDQFLLDVRTIAYDEYPLIKQKIQTVLGNK